MNWVNKNNFYLFNKKRKQFCDEMKTRVTNGFETNFDLQTIREIFRDSCGSKLFSRRFAERRHNRR